MNIQPFEKFHKEWALVSAGNEEDFNTMTVSWGTMGTLWNKSIVTVFVKPCRYTYEYLNNNEYFTVSFFDNEYKKDLGILGTKSKRDCDKMSLTQLHAKGIEHGIDFEEANCTILCKKIYFQLITAQVLKLTRFFELFIMAGDFMGREVGNVSCFNCRR